MISTLSTNISKGMINAIQNTLTDRIKTRIIQNKIVPPKRYPDGRPTLVRSRTLANSIKGHNNGTKIWIGTKTKYARIHQEGGTIVPKNGQYLVFPYRKSGKLYWASVKSVTIPPRPYLYIDEQDKTIIGNRIKEWFSKLT